MYIFFYENVGGTIFRWQILKEENELRCFASQDLLIKNKYYI